MNAATILWLYVAFMASAAGLWGTITVCVWWQCNRLPVHPDDD